MISEETYASSFARLASTSMLPCEHPLRGLWGLHIPAAGDLVAYSPHTEFYPGTDLKMLQLVH